MLATAVRASYLCARAAYPHLEAAQGSLILLTSAAGVEGIIMLGTVGENCSLEEEEKLTVVRTTVQHINKRVPVLTGVAGRSRP